MVPSREDYETNWWLGETTGFCFNSRFEVEEVAALYTLKGVAALRVGFVIGIS